MRWIDKIIDSVDMGEQTLGDSEGTGRPGMLQSYGIARVDMTGIEQQQKDNEHWY